MRSDRPRRAGGGGGPTATFPVASSLSEAQGGSGAVGSPSSCPLMSDFVWGAAAGGLAGPRVRWLALGFLEPRLKKLGWRTSPCPCFPGTPHAQQRLRVVGVRERGRALEAGRDGDRLPGARGHPRGKPCGVTGPSLPPGLGGPGFADAALRGYSSSWTRGVNSSFRGPWALSSSFAG